MSTTEKDERLAWEREPLGYYRMGCGEMTPIAYTSRGPRSTGGVEMADLQESYNDFEAQHVAPEGTTEEWQITDEGAADWAVAKIAQAERNKARRAEFVEAKIQRLRDFQAAEDERDQQTIDYMTGKLHRYFETLRESGALGKRKSYKLPNGTLQARTTGPEWSKDEATLQKWAEERELVRVKVTTAWSDISKRLRPASEEPGAPAVDVETGEIVPGVTLAEPGRDAFSVKVDGGDE